MLSDATEKPGMYQDGVYSPPHGRKVADYFGLGKGEFGVDFREKK